MNSKPAENVDLQEEKSSRMGLTLNERLGLISLIDEGARGESPDSPIVADLFNDLWELVDETVSGSKIDRLKSEDSTRGFKVLEINADTGANLGRLNMLYLKKPIPCYYLVYVEVASPFRNRGLGNRILQEFSEFLSEKSAVGILDNIIPDEDPTYDIYAKLEWRPAREITNSGDEKADGIYMVFIPPALRQKDLQEPLRRLLHHILRKRDAIDMRDNELMVGRTIEEFKELYKALLAYFGEDLIRGEDTSLMRFMFTRFVTKLLGFRRRISSLVGYTGGESLEQIVLHPEVRSLPIQSYAPKEMSSNPSFESGDRELWLKLPDGVKKRPAQAIEALPNYRRPSLVSWMETTGVDPRHTLTIGDLMDLGFDPTRLKEASLEGRDYIIERVQARLIGDVEEKMGILTDLTSRLLGKRVRNAALMTNPPLLLVRDRGNCYVVRHKVPGIHWEEAIEQLQSQPALKALNDSMKIDKLIMSTVRKTIEVVGRESRNSEGATPDGTAVFVSWDLERNRPSVTVDMSGTFLEAIWLA